MDGTPARLSIGPGDASGDAAWPQYPHLHPHDDGLNRFDSLFDLTTYPCDLL